MNVSNMLLHKLQADLKNFGLNPADWRLLPFGKSRFEVRHVTDKEFVLLGSLDPKQSQGSWMSLELFSI